MTFTDAKARALRIAAERRLAAAHMSTTMEGGLRDKYSSKKERVNNSEWSSVIEAERDAEALELLARFVP